MKIGWIRKLLYRINRKHKDMLFCTIFGREKYKKYALQLYNAVNKSSYTNVSDLEIITLTDAIYMKVKNDVAYLVSGNMAIYEHQSTVNPNMPLRGFTFFGELYSKYVKTGHLNIYGKTLVKIPTPQYVVFYNGEDKCPEVTKLRLSDAFLNKTSDGEFEWTATVYNINPGMNKELMDHCEPLRDYMVFIEKVRRYKQFLSIEEAVDRAVRECIEEDVLADVLLEERSAVMLEILTTFDKKAYEDGLREEGREEGRDRVNALHVALFKAGRFDDAVRASEDKDYQEQLMAQLLKE